MRDDTGGISLNHLGRILELLTVFKAMVSLSKMKYMYCAVKLGAIWVIGLKE